MSETGISFSIRCCDYVMTVAELFNLAREFYGHVDYFPLMNRATVRFYDVESMRSAELQQQFARALMSYRDRVI